MTIENVKSFNGKHVNGEQWKEIRNNPNVKLISMLGIIDPSLGCKHEVIFNDKSSIFVFI